MTDTTSSGAIPFRAETRQLLDILIHSLYTEREVFLRELISNASDALTRMNFEMLTNRDVLEPDAPLGIWITTDPEAKTITIRDTGVGMTRDELVENLGTIAHSGARAFVKAAQETQAPVSEIIGQFGVGFYSAFMVAEWIRVTSRSFRKDAEATTWHSTGEDTYTLEPAEKADRGTEVVVKLKDDAAEFAEESRLREIIRRHSDFVPHPITLGQGEEGKAPAQVNQQTALWRQSTREVDAQKYEDFYRQFTLEMEPPITHAHLSVDAPVQLYALLYIPASPEKGIFTIRREDGLKLYARKVLIQEYTRDLLPEYFRFVQGVVDSEDIPLNVSRESIQSTRIMSQLKRVLTGKVVDMLKKLASAKPEEVAESEEGNEKKPAADYAQFWKSFGRFIKEGVATDREALDTLAPLLRYSTLNNPGKLSSLDEYVQNLKSEQKKIYYILGDDERSVIHSPHLDVFRKAGVDVLLMTDPMDSFVLLALTQYKEYPLVNAAQEKPEIPEEEKQEAADKEPALPQETVDTLVQRFKTALGERISDVRTTDRLTDSPARLVDKEGSMNQEVQRVYRMLQKEYEAPEKVLEINPRHPIVKRLSAAPDGELAGMIIEQIYEDALLIEGLHPDPAGMIGRIQKLMNAALGVESNATTDTEEQSHSS